MSEMYVCYTEDWEFQMNLEDEEKMKRFWSGAVGDREETSVMPLQGQASDRFICMTEDWAKEIEEIDSAEVTIPESDTFFMTFSSWALQVEYEENLLKVSLTKQM